MNQEPVRVSSFQEVYEKCQKAGKPLCISVEKDGKGLFLMDLRKPIKENRA